MKYLLALFLLTSISVKGQSKTISDSIFRYYKPCDTCTTSSASVGKIRLSGTSTLSSVPFTYSFTGRANGREMLRIEIPQNKIPFDSLIIYVKKSQIKWLNDSTAVIYKP